MASQLRGPRTFAVTGSNPAVGGTTVPQGILVVSDPANPGNAAVSGAAQAGFLGVTYDATDGRGYVPVQLECVARVKVGASAIVASNLIAADANGMATPVTPSSGGTNLKQVAGIALSSSAAGGYIDMLIQPSLYLG